MKAKRLKIGDTIGIVSPSSATEKKGELIRGIEALEEMGFKVEVARNVDKTRGLVAGSAQERADDINEMFRRDDIDAVFATQGGYGSAQVLEYLDYDLIKSNPKIFTGYSDVTSVHLAISKMTGLVTFHGPGSVRFSPEYVTDFTREYFLKAVNGECSAWQIPLSDTKKNWVYAINGGIGDGEIIGGNLSLVCSTLGTPYEIDTRGKILLLEDVGIEPWIFDHLFCHLYNAGKFNDLKGVVIGDCVRCVQLDYKPAYYSDHIIEDTMDHYLKPFNVPAIYGLPLGHAPDLATVPLGVRGRIDGDQKTFEILESPVL